MSLAQMLSAIVPITIEFFHDVLCAWCYALSPRVRRLVRERPQITVIHRCLALAPTPEAIVGNLQLQGAGHTGSLNHWRAANLNDDEHRINAELMAQRPFDYPYSMPGLLAYKAAELQGGQAAHWDMFDRIQRAHLTECLNIADFALLRQCAAGVGWDMVRWERDFHSPAVREAVESDLERARATASPEYQRSLPKGATCSSEHSPTSAYWRGGTGYNSPEMSGQTQIADAVVTLLSIRVSICTAKVKLSHIVENAMKLLAQPSLLLPLLLFLRSCHDSTDSTTTPGPLSSEPPIRGTWQFEYFETVATGEQDVPPAEMRPVTLSFIDSTCGGAAPCNLYSAKFKLHGIDRITIWELWSTLMACEWLEWEKRYCDALLDAKHYRIRDTELKLYFDNGRKAAVFSWVPQQFER